MQLKSEIRERAIRATGNKAITSNLWESEDRRVVEKNNKKLQQLYDES